MGDIHEVSGMGLAADEFFRNGLVCAKDELRRPAYCGLP